MKYDWLKKMGVSTKDLYNQPLASKTQATANTAGEKVVFDIPTDQLLYGIDLYDYSDQSGNAALDKISEIELKLDGSKTIRDMTGNMVKAKDIVYGQKPSTGFYNINVADPVLGADPIPLKSFSSCTLTVTVAAGGSSIKNVIQPTLRLGARQSYPSLGNMGAGKVLVETFLPQVAYGANLGDLEYKHMRSQNIVGYIYETGDADTLANTTFDQLTLKLYSANGTLTPIDHVSIAQIIEWTTQANNGNALPTGLIYLPFPDALKTGEFTNVSSLLHASVAGTNKQVRVLESYLLGGV